MCSHTEHFSDSYRPNDRHTNEEKECREMNEATVTPYILEEWKKNMMFWKNHDTCRRIFNWVREVLGSLDEYFLRKIFNKLLHDGELVNDHVRMYLHMHGYNVKEQDIIDVPYWMHIAFLQVMHLVYLDDDIMLSEPVEELTRPRLQHKNAKNITIMLNMFFEYISQSPFLMAEFPMNNWKNFSDHVGGSMDYFDEVPFAMIDEGIEGCLNVNPINDFCQENPSLSIDDDDSDVQSCSNRFVSSFPSPLNVKVNNDCTLSNEGAEFIAESVPLLIDDISRSGDDSDARSCLTRFVSSSSSPSNVEINNSCTNTSANCFLINESAAITASLPIDIKSCSISSSPSNVKISNSCTDTSNEGAAIAVSLPIDVQSHSISSSSPSSFVVNKSCAGTNCSLSNEGAASATEFVRSVDIISTTEIGVNNQLRTPSLMDSHPSWNSLVFQSSSGGSGRRAKLRVKAGEKAQFNTLAFNAFFGARQENIPLTSRVKNKKLAEKSRSGIFFGLTIFFNDRALHIGQNLKALVTCNGGKVCEKLKKTATHIVTSKPVPWYRVDDLRRNTNCRVVKPEWVMECSHVGRRVNEGAFNMAGLQRSQPTILSFINGGMNERLSPTNALFNIRKREREDISDFEESGDKRRRVNVYVGLEETESPGQKDV